ncbi:MAG: ABC transporter ATP-binding protein/permease [Oscillospiraceae bacterium]|nr:ABC transporter ATP-binding protein/permease [Oscillospiraceae bacterium]
MSIFINIVGVVHGVSHALEMFVNRYLFDAVTAAAGGGALDGLLAPVLAFGILYVSKTFLNGLHNFLYHPWEQKSIGAIRVALSEKCGQIDPIDFENPELLDDINKAKEGVMNAFVLPANLVTLFTFYVPFFIVSAAFLFTLKPLLLLIMLAMFVPAVLMLVVRTKLYSKLEERSAPIRRKYEYFESAICGKESFKETRLFGAFAFFKKLYYDSLMLLNKEMWKTEKKTVLTELFLRLFMLSGYFGMLYALFYYLMRGEISVGSFAAVFSALGTLCMIIEEIVVRHLGNIAKDVGKVQNLVRFLKMPARRGSDEYVDRSGDIVLENVSFRYPGAAEDAVKGVSLTIRSGETLAIVGENGAGKTTLMRLICGIYLPAPGGRVLAGDKDLSTVEPGRAYADTSAVFQRVQRYQMTLHDNIDIGGLGGDVTGSLHKADLAPTDASLFPDGLDTMLSREFDGVDLSGGQWQRVSIARGLHRPSVLILLDEPTAAIDPIEEARTYERFAELSKDQTSIIVTHRMGSVKIADRILVLDAGRIDDIGTHDELMQKGGLYATMWQSQAQWYA